MSTLLKVDLSVEQLTCLIQDLSAAEWQALRAVIERGPEEVRRLLSETLEAVREADGRLAVAEERAGYRTQQLAGCVSLLVDFEQFVEAFRRLTVSELESVLDELEDWYLAQSMIEDASPEMLSREKAWQEYRSLLAAG